MFFLCARRFLSSRDVETRPSTRVLQRENSQNVSFPEQRGSENLGRRRNISEALDLIESLIKCTPAPITEPFYDFRFGKLSENVPD